MKCPNCGFENAEGSTECVKCQVVFAKWEQRRSVASSEPPPPAAKSSALPLLAGLALAACAGGWFFLRTGAASAPPAPEAASSAPAAPSEAAATPSPSSAETSAPVPAPIVDPWRFEGKVIDLLHDTPIEGAEVTFSKDQAGLRFSAKTDPSGRYALELKPLEKGGYEVQVSHPDYDGRHWDAKSAAGGRKQRYQLANRIQAFMMSELSRFVGQPNVPTTYDFALFPSKLTEEEQTEQFNAISGGPARD